MKRKDMLTSISDYDILCSMIRLQMLAGPGTGRELARSLFFSVMFPVDSGKVYKNYCERTFFYYLTVPFCSPNAFSISASVSNFEKLMLFFSPYVLSHAGIVIFFLTALFPYFSA